MNSDMETKLKGLHQSLALQPEEKEAVRARLQKAIKADALRRVPVAAPTRFEAFFAPLRMATTIPVAICLALVLGGGLSFEAEKSLPGDFLYPLKTDFNERLLGVVAVTPQAQALLQAQLADRRLSEVEALTAENKLGATTSAELMSAFESHAAAAEQSISALTAAGDAHDATDVSVALTSAIQAHDQIMQILNSRRQNLMLEASTTLPTSVAASSVVSASGTNAPARRKNKNGGEDYFRTAAQNIRNLASSTLGEAEATVTGAPPASGNTALDAQNNFSAARAQFEDGDRAYRDGQFNQAFRSFQSAIRQAEAARNATDEEDGAAGTSTAPALNIPNDSILQAPLGGDASSTLPVDHRPRIRGIRTESESEQGDQGGD